MSDRRYELPLKICADALPYVVLNPKLVATLQKRELFEILGMSKELDKLVQDIPVRKEVLARRWRILNERNLDLAEHRPEVVLELRRHPLRRNASNSCYDVGHVFVVSAQLELLQYGSHLRRFDVGRIVDVVALELDHDKPDYVLRD